MNENRRNQIRDIVGCFACLALALGCVLAWVGIIAATRWVAGMADGRSLVVVLCLGGIFGVVGWAAHDHRRHW